MIALQWLVVVSFVSHSYSWWVKAGQAVVTANTTKSLLMLAFALAASLFATWQYVKFPEESLWFRLAALFTALTGIAGQLVYSGMVISGMITFVAR